jgi:hypothetical protein
LNMLDDLLGSLDGEVFGEFLFGTLTQPGTISLINAIIGDVDTENESSALNIFAKLVQPYQEVDGGFAWQDIEGLYDDPDFNWEDVRHYFNWEKGDGLYPALLGNRGENDGLLDYMWILSSVEKLTMGSMTVWEYMGEVLPGVVRNMIELQTENLANDPGFQEWWDEWMSWLVPSDKISPAFVADTLGNLLTDDLSIYLGAMLGRTLEIVFENASYYVKVKDTSIGETPVWDMPFWTSDATTPDPWGPTPYLYPDNDDPDHRISVPYSLEDYMYERDENGDVIVRYPYYYIWSPDTNEVTVPAD